MFELLSRLFGGRSGPRVRTVGRAQVVYADGAHRMRIEAEMLTGPEDWVVYTDSIRRWDPPFQDEPVTPADRQRIIDAILEEFRRGGEVVELAERPVIEPWAGSEIVSPGEDEGR